MNTLVALVNRNRKLYFKDRGMLLTAMITPAILIVLYVTFLAKVYKESFLANLPAGFGVSEEIIDGVVSGQLAAALLAVSCVTVTFIANMVMVQDKTTGACRDFQVSPVKRPVVYTAYFIATVINSLMVNLVALVLCLVYVYRMGWYLTATDVCLLIGDTVLLVLFGCVLSSIVCYPLRTQGQMSAVQSIISAGYGFVCGAYMPISNFGEGLQKAMSFLPGTYGTSLIKNHFLRGVFEEMETVGFPAEVVHGIGESLDCYPEFGGSVVTTGQMYAVLAVTIVVLGGLYLLMTVFFRGVESDSGTVRHI